MEYKDLEKERKKQRVLSVTEREKLGDKERKGSRKRERWGRKAT